MEEADPAELPSDPDEIFLHILDPATSPSTTGRSAQETR